MPIRNSTDTQKTRQRLLWLNQAVEADVSTMADAFMLCHSSAREWADRLVGKGVLSRTMRRNSAYYRIERKVVL